jgi:hypothetical protein
VPLLIIIAIMVIYYMMQDDKAGPAGQSDLSSRPIRTPHGNPVQLIREHDPAFDPGAFCNRVGNGFIKLQQAWCEQNLQAVRPFISDAVHERFSLQFAEQRAEGYRDYMDRIGIDNMVINDATSDEIYDEVSLAITAHAADFKISLVDGSPIHGRAPVEPFVEIWTFLRRRGAATLTGKPGLMEGNCPNCGAAIELNESANCKNCGALLRSGQYDWVLSEITQASEWNPGRHAMVPGLNELRQRDPDLNVQALEDRASVIFWRKAAADRIGKIDPMVKVTSPTYAAAYAARLQPSVGRPRTCFGKCAVGAVDVIGFIAAGGPSLVERALIGIRWSGVRMIFGPGGQAQVAGDNLPHHTLFVLMRQAAAKTDVAKGVASAHCPNCGAPESGGTSGACEFCGTALNDGSTGWVLDNILSFTDAEAQRLIAGLRNA